MATRTPLPAEAMRELLHYEPETGKLFWLARPESAFSSARAQLSWNARWAGKEAFTATNYGYPVGNINARTYQGHRVIWAIVHGVWPEHDLDHINGDRADNRLANLREATRSENLCNRDMSPQNTSGHKGVYFHEKTQKWRAHIKKDGKFRFLGCFPVLDDAIAARALAADKLHGEFARAA